ncbi:hypothetical protein ACFW04_008658 [Cataglyphis niger]
MLLQRKQKGYFNTLFQFIKNNDDEQFFKFTEMTVLHFERILELVQEQKKSIRELMSPEHRLCIYQISKNCGTCRIVSERLMGSTSLYKLLTILEPVFSFIKKTFSIVLMAACDAKYIFTLVDVGAFGSQTRHVIENFFGILASRWRIFRPTIIAHVDTAEWIVCAGLSENVMYCPPNYADTWDNEGNVISGQWRQCKENVTFKNMGRMGANNATCKNIILRDTLAEYFISPEGARSI